MIINKKLPALILLILGTLLSVSTFACVPAKVSLEQRVAAAQFIYIGVVTDVHDVKKKEGSAGISQAISPSVTPYLLDVSVTEVIKGEDHSGHIHPSIENCGSGSANENEKVIVFLSDGYWYITKFEPEIYSELLVAVKQISVK